ncbi:class III extradiol dioxygenase subunit B-like domain-containing protein [Nonomuraea africana]|uniref:Extradiol ring-cleavage dioxygenase class III enzyme subunit B domain-containing protein n=1 Tax=Nonomuraea africana TaxID=46171 RepID=A0ABR9KK66_9ACTN|nr:hypothetical protein [Nonomuraea africana]MBE1562416.1 hypothetical protein [Nonomuraea africana]
MLVAAAVCPHPPLIVPELAGAAAPELDGLRAACAAAIRAVLAVDHDLLVVVGGDERTTAYGGQPAGTLAPWGVDVRVGEGEPVLPLSLTIGRWLLDAQRTGVGTTGEVAFQGVASGASAEECLALGAALVDGRRIALLVMGDGSACLTEKSPGFLHPAAGPYNDEIARALAEADAGALAAMDPERAAELWVGGRAALQVLAGAADGVELRPELLEDSAPYGVGYFVATWT